MLATTGSAQQDNSSIFLIEMGGIVVILALLGRLAYRFRMPPIPLYLLGGLALGDGGLVPLGLSEEFVGIGADLGVILLLLLLGLEFTAEELRAGLRTSLPVGVVNLVLNFTPGLLAGLLLGWGPVEAMLLGGITYNTSSGTVAKVLADLNRLGNRETPSILSMLVIEDLSMAVYLPLMVVVLAGGGLLGGFASVAAAVGAVALILYVAFHHGDRISRVLGSHSDEVLLLSIFGLALLVGGIAQGLQISSAIGAFLVGLAISGSVAVHARQLLGPLRDLFAAIFFFFFGMRVDPAILPAVLPVAAGLAVVTAATKVGTGWWAAQLAGVALRGRLRAGFTLVARGEFSIIVAGLGVAAGLDARLGSLAAAYVLSTAIAGPLLARVSDPLAGWLRSLTRRLGLGYRER